MKPTIAVIMPVFVRTRELLDLTYETLRSLHSDVYDLFPIVMVNRMEVCTIAAFAADVKDILGGPHWIRHGQERCVAGTWNEAIRTADAMVDYRFALILNNDLVLEPTTIDRLAAFGSTIDPRTGIDLWSAINTRDHKAEPPYTAPDGRMVGPFRSGADFSCYMIRPDFGSRHGLFDENYMPCYWEDTDMAARIYLARRELVTVTSAGYYHAGSMTIRSDPEAAKVNARTYVLNHAYFQRKWGVPTNLPDQEQIRKQYYQTPFNIPNKALSWWPAPERVEFL